MASRKFGWHSGTLKCQDIKAQGDLFVQDDIVFSDVSAGVLGVTGGIDMQSTTSAIGIDMGGTFSTAAINIDGTCSTAGIVMAGGSSYNPIHIGVKANTAGSGLDMSGADSWDDHNGVMIFCDDGDASLAATYTTSAIWTRYLITKSQSSNTATGAYLQVKSLAATFTSCDYSATKVYLELAGAITLASGNLSVINAGLELGGAFTDTAQMLSGIDVNINDGTNALDTTKASAGVRIRKTSGSTAGFPIGLYIEDVGATTGISIGECSHGIRFTADPVAGDVTNSFINVGDYTTALAVAPAGANMFGVMHNVTLTSSVAYWYQAYYTKITTSGTTTLSSIAGHALRMQIGSDLAAVYGIQSHTNITADITLTSEIASITAYLSIDTGHTLTHPGGRAAAFIAMIANPGGTGTFANLSQAAYVCVAENATVDEALKIQTQSTTTVTDLANIENDGTCTNMMTFVNDGTATYLFHIDDNSTDFVAGAGSGGVGSNPKKIKIYVDGGAKYLICADDWT